MNDIKDSKMFEMFICTIKLKVLQGTKAGCRVMSLCYFFTTSNL